MTQSERRGAARVAERVTLGIRNGGIAVTAETKNLSATGAYCLVDTFIPPMTKLQLEFELPSGARRVRVACTGVVVRIEPIITSPERGRYHVAIYFNDLSDRNRKAIGSFVRHRLDAAAAQ